MKKATKWTIALVVLGFVLAGIFLTVAPDRIPAHYNIRGEVDRWGSKYEMLILPVINLFFGVFMVLVARHEGKQGREMNEKIMGIMNNWILVLFNALWAVFLWKAVDPENLGSGLGDLSSKVILMLLSASLIPMGNIMPKAQRNSIYGLRTRWSMVNDHCWQQSQRIGGYVMVAAGVLGTILTAILPVLWGGIAVTVLLIAAAIGCTWASWRVYMRSQVR